MSNKEILDIAVDDFKRSVEITRDVRFQANLRLGRRQRASSYMVSILSLYVISLSLIPNIYDLNKVQGQLLLACSVVLSAFIIFTSLIDGAQNFYHQGELLHQCARRVATIHHELKTIKVDEEASLIEKKLKELQEKYQKALDECPINHDNVDFYREIARKPHLFPVQYRFKYKLPVSLFYLFMGVVLEYSWIFFHIIAFIVVSLLVYMKVLA